MPINLTAWRWRCADVCTWVNIVNVLAAAFAVVLVVVVTLSVAVALAVALAVVVVVLDALA
jgi:hypothetical protein